MAYDKAIDSTYLNLGLSEIADKIREKGGTTDMLTFPDGFVTAIGAIEGGEEEEVLVNTKYRVDIPYVEQIVMPADWNSKTWYKSYYISDGEWIGVDGKFLVLAESSELTGRYMYDSATSKMYYCPYCEMAYYSPNMYVYTIGDLDSYGKTPIGTHNDEYPLGTYEFVNGQIYYYTEENCELATVAITSTCNGINGDTSHIIITSPTPFAPDSSNPSNTVTTWEVWCYDMPNCTITIPTGSKIKCFVRDTKASNRGYISINGENVLEGNGNYTYIVTQDIAIDVSDAYSQGEYGIITITE